MKYCPVCQQVYDETMNFCLDDGTPLDDNLSMSETVVMSHNEIGSNAPAHAFDTQNILRLLPSIAVMPFANISADEENEYFCDGLTEELLNALAKIEGMKVVARSSAFSLKGKNVSIKQIGNLLNVNSVLEGSVRRAGNRVRINVQLINANDGFQLWSEKYDREIEDIFQIQDEITLATVDALKVRLFGHNKSIVLKRYTKNTKAYELYLKGIFERGRGGTERQKKAVGLFEQAIALDENYALAYAELAFTYRVLLVSGAIDPKEFMPKAEAAARRALEIDNELAEGHYRACFSRTGRLALGKRRTRIQTRHRNQRQSRPRTYRLRRTSEPRRSPRRSRPRSQTRPRTRSAFTDRQYERRLHFIFRAAL